MSEFDIVNESPYQDYVSAGSYLSPDGELLEDQTLEKLWRHSTKLIKNNFIAASAQQAYINSIIGGSIKLSVMTKDKTLQRELEDVILKNFNGIDINRDLSMTRVMETIIAGAFEYGDILINLPMDKYRKGKSIKTFVELVSADRIKTPPKHVNNVHVRQGVHYYSNGRIKGYWVIKSDDKRKSYMSAQDGDFSFFPAYKSDGKISRMVCYMFKSPFNLKPNQSRQVPILSPIMGVLKYYNQYLEAVLIGSRVAACFSAFVKTDNPVAAQKSLTETNTKTGVNVKGGKLTKLQPGTISYLKRNEDITFASPNKPSDNFDAFVLRLSKYCAMGIRLSYEHMFLDLSETNYSSWRGASLEVVRNINRWRRDLTEIIRWISFTFFRESLVRGEITRPLLNVTLAVTYPKYKSLDEEKTARANRLDLDNALASKKGISDEQGKDFDDLQDELDVESVIDVNREAEKLILQKKLSEKHGIFFEGQVTEEDRDTSDSRRKGESKDSDLSDEEKQERRKEDGNW